MYGITLHYLPPYSPNLNPIERLWKVMNEYVRNNRFFKSAKEFKKEILTFFEPKGHPDSEAILAFLQIEIGGGHFFKYLFGPRRRYVTGSTTLPVYVKARID